MKRTSVCLLILAVMTFPLLAGQRTNPKKGQSTTRATTAPEAAKNDAVSQAAEPRARTVRYSASDVVQIKAKLRYTTLIVLPKNEQILDFTCGDQEYWIVN